MKIVVVTAQTDVIPYLKAQEKLRDCLFVQYAHPLKALDNLAEIDPDLIIWNADDYPRHWKICRAFCPRRPAEKAVALFLVTEKGLGEEEEKKSQYLDVDDIIEDGFFGESLLTVLERRLPKTANAAESPAEVSPAWLVRDPGEWPQGPGNLLFIHPGMQQLLIADILASDGRSLSVSLADPADLAACRGDILLETATISVGGINRKAILKGVPTGQADQLRFLILHLAA